MGITIVTTAKIKVQPVVIDAIGMPFKNRLPRGVVVL